MVPLVESTLPLRVYRCNVKVESCKKRLGVVRGLVNGILIKTSQITLVLRTSIPLHPFNLWQIKVPLVPFLLYLYMIARAQVKWNRTRKILALPRIAWLATAEP